MNHQGLRWNVHCVANVALRIRLNLYKRGFKIYDLLVTCTIKRKVKKIASATGTLVSYSRHARKSVYVGGKRLK